MVVSATTKTASEAINAGSRGAARTIPPVALCVAIIALLYCQPPIPGGQRCRGKADHFGAGRACAEVFASWSHWLGANRPLLPGGQSVGPRPARGRALIFSVCPPAGAG